MRCTFRMSNERGHSRWPAWHRLCRLRLPFCCPNCMIACDSGCIALSNLRGKHSSGARVWDLADLLQAPMPDGLSLPHLHLNLFFSWFILIYWNSCVIHAYQCTNPVDLPWRTGARLALVQCYKHRADSGPVVVCCEMPTVIWKQMMKYCKIALVTW